MSPSLTEIVILSVIQGATEPLPVSSSAHVIAAERIMRLDPSSPQMTFLLAMLHTGTIAAVVAYFWKSWGRTFFSGPGSLRETVSRVFWATFATLCVFEVLEQLIKRTLLRGRPGAQVEDLFSNAPLVAAALAAGGALILYSGLRARSAAPTTGAGGPVPPGAAAWIGAVQGLVVPFRGLSRSGATISAGMLMGVDRRVCEEFSFALAVVITPPVIVRELLRYYRERAAQAAQVDLGGLVAPGVLGMACSFLAGLVALRWLSGWLAAGRWHYFGAYCLVASVAYLALSRAGF
jgi:undecaprenyl-diphosphatase